jgi:hypothetical protein
MYIPYIITHKELIKIKLGGLSVIKRNRIKRIIEIDEQKNILPQVDSSFLVISQKRVKAQFKAKVIKNNIITKFGLEITQT